MLRAVLFDLDDTLFPQAEYLKGAWRAVAVRGIEWGIPHEAFARELKSVAAEGSDRGRIIDRALARVGRSDVSSAPLVDVFQSSVKGVSGGLGVRRPFDSVSSCSLASKLSKRRPYR